MSANPPVKHLWPNFWRLLKPYWVSKEGRKGWVLLLLILVLTGGSVYLAKAFNSWYNDFYNSMQNYDLPGFQKSLLLFC